MQPRLAPSAVLPALFFLSCNSSRVKPEECTSMLDRYIDMVISGDPELANLSATQAQAAREMKKAVKKSESSYRRVHDQCESEVTRREYTCAMEAKTPEGWQACID